MGLQVFQKNCSGVLSLQQHFPRFLNIMNSGNPLQYSCLENPMDRGAWRATVHGVTNSQTRLNTRACTHALSTYTDKHTGKKRQPLVMKDGPDTGHTKHKYSDFSRNIYLSVLPYPTFFLDSSLLEQPIEIITQLSRLLKTSPDTTS